jgi:hypothetical protein
MVERSQIHAHLLAQTGRQRERAQQIPRPARIRMTVRTTGLGESRMTGRQALDFGAFLLEEPSFSWGVIVQDSLSTGQLPICNAMVLKWVRNEGGLYTGAEMGFVVQAGDSLVGVTNMRLQFSLTFEASTLRTTAGTGTSAAESRH